ncbi:EVE domain-containing protein [Psychrosphaera aquimarina]|uniref:EVE domain-containing protein n=1 Tax=Psychrosphaera aquimarina TaxID=2044854 RepID=A0ABU3QVK6_9GAMM|nr:EVE domain-containing protein [Psychrosphaera aquimarina]MDU0111457.1 EVE domain-containing protein [Psychrosphaera aquimarina]
MNYWLFKSEPDDYSLLDLKNDKNSTVRWDGIRNYQARNLLRDEIKVGDQVLFYHSSCKNIGVAGTAKVVSSPYPDPLQFNPESKYYDPKSKPESPRWVSLDIQYQQEFIKFVPLALIKATKALEEMVLVKRGRLSIQPVTEAEWNIIMKMAKLV